MSAWFVVGGHRYLLLDPNSNWWSDQFPGGLLIPLSKLHPKTNLAHYQSRPGRQFIDSDVTARPSSQMIPITIWMNMPSFYQGDLFRDLLVSSEIDLQVVYARQLTSDRLELGWQSDVKGYPLYFLNSRKPIFDGIRLAWEQRKRVHLVNGLWGEPAFAAALIILMLSGSAFAIYSESPDLTIHRSASKKLLRSAFGRMVARRAAGFLAVSKLAMAFFKSLGAEEHLIYPFGYFRSGPKLTGIPVNSQKDGPIEVIFVGQVVHRKGLDLLIDAMQPLFEEYQRLRLTVIGSGELLPSLREQINKLGLEERVVFEGALAANMIPSRLSAADLLVLPSRWDGWGLVINEALSAGVPVIVSDYCGAADLVRNGINGYVFRSEDVLDLRRCLNEFLKRKPQWPEFKAQSSATGDKISTEAMAPYFIKFVKHITGVISERPTPPWMQ